MEYDEIVESMIADERMMSYLLEGVNMSPLCIGRIDDETADCFLVTYNSEQGKEVLQWRVKRAVNHKEEWIIEALEAEGVLDTKDGIQGDNLEEAIEQYASLYSKIREIAFRPKLTKEEQDSLACFMKSWYIVLEKDVKEQMEESFPEFFIWVKKEVV